MKLWILPPWLAKKKNIELLSKATNLNIEVIETEASVGNFSTDILAKDLDNNRTIIIENQLEPIDVRCDMWLK